MVAENFPIIKTSYLYVATSGDRTDEWSLKGKIFNIRVICEIEIIKDQGEQEKVKSWIPRWSQ